MNRERLLRAASLLAPSDQRAAWLEEWRSELWYVPPRRATRFCLGAFRDALWVRRNNPDSAKRSLFDLASPYQCLSLLAALAAASLAITRLSSPGLTAGGLVMLPFTCVLLPATRLAMGRGPAGRHPAPGRLRGWTFLALKIALVQPLMFCGFVLQLPLSGFALAPLALCSFWILTLRWVLADQQRRCPVCLRLLTRPVRIGTPSHTFLEWYGAESMCSRGHGLLHISEISTIYSLNRQWLELDDLFVNRGNDETRTAQCL
jgi:hypothetical protein